MFKVGDVVQLKSGGTPATVVEISEYLQKCKVAVCSHRLDISDWVSIDAFDVFTQTLQSPSPRPRHGDDPGP